METSDCSPLDSSAEATEPSRVTDDAKSWGFDHWNLVDVPGSPLLSRLFEALKIECESTIPSLDLTSPNPAGALLPIQEEESGVEMNGDVDAEEWVDFFTGPSSKDLARYSREVFQRPDTFSTNSNLGLAELSFSEWSFREWDFSKGQPLKLNISHIIGLSPFPALSEDRLRGTSHHGNSSPHAGSQYWQDMEIEWKCRVQKLKRILGGENPNTLVAMKKLGYIYEEQYKFRQAERLYRQIAISYQKTLGFKHVTTLDAYLEVVSILHVQGELLQALKIHEFIHDTINQLVAQDNSLTLRSNSLRTILIYPYGKLDEADKLIRQTLQIELHTLGPRHKVTLYDMNILSKILKRFNKFDESEQLLRNTLRLCQVLEGPFSGNFLQNLLSLTDLLEFQGRYDECRDLAMTIVERLNTSVDREHYDFLHCLYKVAICARYQGDILESERLMRSVLAQQIEIFGEKHLVTYRYSTELSRTLICMGRHSEAVTLLEGSYEGLAKSHGMSYKETIWTCQELGVTYASLGRYEDAVGLLQRTIYEARKPAEKPTKDLLEIISDLGVLFREAGRYAEAIPLQEECLHGFVEINGLLDRWTIDTIDELGLCYEGLRRYDDAFALYEQSINQIRSLEGDEHPAIIKISKWITGLRETLAADDEEVNESQEDSDSMEASVEEAVIDEQNGDTDDRLAKGDVRSAEVDWMGNFFDFDLLENAPPDTET
jgi:tetratricopeptide (TPR) repeat protein